MLKKLLLGFLGFLVLIAIGGYGYYRLYLYEAPLISDEDRQAIDLMPLPAKLSLEGGTLDLSKGVQFQYPENDFEFVNMAVNRWLSRIEHHFAQSLPYDTGIAFEIINHSQNRFAVPQPEADESYQLEISRNRIRLEAQNQHGILWGLETLFQLIETEENKLKLPRVSISDQPRFPWRGLMVDVCRHWIPKEAILRILEGMQVAKMNVFHWHLSEDQGFRVESNRYPKLHEIGGNGHYYSQEDIKEVIQFAADRGIRVVPEFDLPGHSKSWQIAYPALSSVDQPLEFGTKKGAVFSPPIDPTREEVYEFLDRLLGEMADLFPDPYFHIGGDEINPTAWNESPRIQAFMEENGMEDHQDLQAYFIKRMQVILKKHGKKMLGWDEILHPDLEPGIMVQSWRSHKSLFQSVQQNSQAILSAGWYLDHILSAGDHYLVDPLILPGAVDLVPDSNHWKMYDMKMVFGGNEMQSQLVLFDRNPDSISGFFAMMHERMAFKDGRLDGNQLTFSLNGPVGEMQYKAQLSQDKIEGDISFGLLSFDVSGIRSGGNDMPQTQMPTIEIMRPLSASEEASIMGGEACQWSEFVDGANVESRIWPRTAAIAEKLWSPQSLTQDVEDMYRRMAYFSQQLAKGGSHHLSNYTDRIREFIPAAGLPHLLHLTDYLQEVEYHGRMPALFNQDFVYLPDFKLDQLVDVVVAESMPARAFNKLVEAYVANPADEKVTDAIRYQLQIWAQNHALLLPYLQDAEKLALAEPISQKLSALATLALAQMEQPGEVPEAVQKDLQALESGINGMVLGVVPGLREILNQ